MFSALNESCKWNTGLMASFEMLLLDRLLCEGAVARFFYQECGGGGGVYTHK